MHTEVEFGTTGANSKALLHSRDDQFLNPGLVYYSNS